MKVSVIVPTFQGGHKLPQVLQALQNQTIKDFEVIVSVDGSKDGTIHFLENQTIFKGKFSWVYQENMGRASCRNFGAKHAQHDLLVFFDDDMRPLPNVLEQHVSYHHRFDIPLVCSGVQIEEKSKMQTDIQRYKCFLSQKWNGEKKEGHLGSDHLFLTAAHLSIQKSTFDAFGGFDERLQDAEDFCMALKANASGCPVHFLKSAVAYHDDFITCHSYIRRQIQYQKAHALVRVLYPDLIQEKSNSTIDFPFYKKWVYRYFKNPIWIKRIDQENFYWFMIPKLWRYKIYEWVIYSQGVLRNESPLVLLDE